MTLALLALGTGCGTGPTEPRPTFGARLSLFTDEQLLQVAYSDYDVPPGFYQEDSGMTSAYYANTLSIANRLHQPDPPWTELATEDVETARIWVQATIDNSDGVYAPASPPVVTERYIEFPYTYERAHSLRIRVHRASYLTGAPFGSTSPDGPLGVFHGRQLRSDAVRGLAEYLWWTRGWGGKVLAEYVAQTPTEWRVTMFVVQLHYSSFGMTDTISLDRVVYHVDKLGGAVRRESSAIRHLRGHPR